jgi:DNA modification methylase
VVDNRTTRIGQDDTTKITDILAELANTPIGLDGTGYGAADLDALIDELAGTTEPAELLTNPDEVPEDVETRCQPGDLWILGRHRLLCGDSTKADDVARLMDGTKADMMFTDPPYNIDYQGVKDKREKIKNDKMSDNDFLEFLQKALMPCDVVYVCCSWQYSHIFKKAMETLQISPKAMIVWDKINPAQHLDLYYKQHELIFYYGPFGGNKTVRGDVWQLKRQRNTVHPTMKPIELIETAMQDHSAKLIYDPFLGSGSTLITSEQLNRQCYGLEIDPHYCDVIIQRWENATGQKAVLDGR